MRASGLRGIALALAGAMLWMAGAAAVAAELTVIRHVDFNADVVGQPPSTGGPNQPTSLIAEAGTSIRVQAAANGIAAQPVVLSAQTGQQYVSVDTSFPPVSQGLVRVEATVSFDRLARGYFMQTSVGATTAVVTRLTMSEAGEIQDFMSGATVGTYAPNQPFRVRMDIDMSARNWSVTIDDEMNGFQDDAAIGGLAFANDDPEIPAVGSLDASMQMSFLTSPPTTIAYDDIEVWMMTETVSPELAPGPFPSIVVPRSRLLITVSIPGTATFDASTVNPATVRFGATGTEAPPASHALEDADGDGDTDMTLRFRTEQTGIQCGDTSAILTGRTFGGVIVQGSVAIRTVGCRP